MERFVRAIVAGGIALVAGLWVVYSFGQESSPWLAGVVLVVLGVVGLLWGIGSEIEV